MNQQITMKQFVKRIGCKASSASIAANPNMADETWEANHYMVTLRATISGQKKQFSVTYSMGLGLKGKPTAEDILSSVALDASSVENARSFGEWAEEMGYEMKSIRQAEKTYKACWKIAQRLKKFLGPKLYNELLYEVESL